MAASLTPSACRGVRVRLYSQTQPRKYLYRILPSVIGCAVHESGSGCDMTGHGPRPIVPPRYRCHGIGAGQCAFGGCARSLWNGTGKVFQDLTKKSKRKIIALKCMFLSMFQGEIEALWIPILGVWGVWDFVNKLCAKRCVLFLNHTFNSHP